SRHRRARRRQRPVRWPGEWVQSHPPHHPVPQGRCQHTCGRLLGWRRRGHQALAAGAGEPCRHTGLTPHAEYQSDTPGSDPPDRTQVHTTENDMSKAIRIHTNGGPEVMKYEDVPTPDPGPNEALIKQAAVGLNYIDVYFRTGLYKAPSMPLVIGQEGAGTVTAVGASVTNVKPGDRVAYAGPIGGYASDRVIPADRLVKLPDAIPFETGAAMMLQGMTAQYLLRRTCTVKSGDTIVVHAAAGGVGLILCQWAKHLGATVIGVVSSDEKAELARAHGAAHTVVGYSGLVAEVKRVTAGAMVPVVYDSVGKDTF